MMPGGIPDVPDPTKIVKSGTEAAKATAQGVVGIGVDVAAGVQQILFNTIEGAIGAISDGARDLTNIIKTDVNIGKATAENVRRDIDMACNAVLTHVDQGIGAEVVRKFKSEVERRLR